MKISIKRFVVASKESPTEFWLQNGDEDEDIMEAILYETEKSASSDIQDADEPEAWKIMPVEIIYRF